MYHVYADESYKDTHKFLILGGLVLDERELASIEAELAAVRRKHHKESSEVKWSKSRSGNLRFYKDFLQVFFDRAEKDELHFHCMYVDTHTFNHHRYNMGSGEIGFNKLIFQLLLHKFGRRYGANSPLFVYLDHRDAKDDPESIRPMLNSTLARDWENHSRPFRGLQFRKSHKCELIQLNDLLIGAVGFRKNKRHHAEGVAQHKCELALHIVHQVMKLQPRPERIDARRFTLWNFKYKG
jgi:hypothetical protein